MGIQINRRIAVRNWRTGATSLITAAPAIAIPLPLAQLLRAQQLKPGAITREINHV